MRIAMLGTRGVPARYGGFETAVEQIGKRLVAGGHEVVVYCRGAQAPRLDRHLGMELVHLPAARRKSLETLTHTAASVSHVWRKADACDVALVFNSANAVFLPALHRLKVPVAVHVDGLEWRRAKWAGAGRRYYRAVESLSVRWADALIADAPGIADYYATEFGAETVQLAYGAPIQEGATAERIAALQLTARRYHLVVARFEPENHVAEIVAGYVASNAELPLVVVGSAPYAGDYTARIEALAGTDPRVRLLGGIWDDHLLDELYANALTYLHGHSVGGTNPSLLRAMGAGTGVIAFDVAFNSDVLGEEGLLFCTPAELACLLGRAETNPDSLVLRGSRLKTRAESAYRWDDVAAGYEQLLQRLVAGHSTRGRATGRRRNEVTA